MHQQLDQELIEEVYKAAFRADVKALDELAAQLRGIGSDEAVGAALFCEASSARVQGNRDRCFDIFEECASVLHGIDRPLRARAVMNLGRLSADRRDFERATAFFDEARREYSDIGDHVGVARVDANQASMHQYLGEHDRAYELFNAALAAFRAYDQQYDVAIVLSNITGPLTLRGETENVYAALQEARSIYDALGNHHGSTQILIRLTMLYHQLGEASVALAYANKAIEHAQLGSDPSLKAQALGRMADILWQTGDFDRSIEFYNRELQVHESIQNVNGMARVQLGLGTVYWNLGDIASALEHFHRALSLEESLSVRHSTAHALGNIGSVYMSLGDAARALPYQIESLQLHVESGLLNEVADMNACIASTYSTLGDTESAILHSAKAMELNRELHRGGEAVFSQLSHSAILIQMGRIDEARATMSELDHMKIESPMYRSMYHGNYGRLLALEGDLDTAIQQFETSLEICTAHNYRVDIPELYRELRELSLKKNDLAGYVRHNEEYQRTSEELRGAKRAHQVATLEAERRIAAERAERERERTILYSTLPQQIADRVIRGEQAQDHYDNAAVLFLDIVGFTTLSATMHPSALAALLDQVFGICDDACQRHGLTKIKTIGDSYLAAAFDQEHCTQHAASAAIDIINTLSEGSPVSVRIGIHCGPIFAGVIGRDRLQYDIWGDTVNVASRLEGTSEPGRIHISQHVADTLAPGTWHLALRGETDLKGKGTLVTYWLDPAAGG